MRRKNSTLNFIKRRNPKDIPLIYDEVSNEEDKIFFSRRNSLSERLYNSLILCMLIALMILGTGMSVDLIKAYFE